MKEKQSRGMRLWFGFFCLVCAAALVLSLLGLTAPEPLPDSAAVPAGGAGWLVRDKGGRVAVYTVDAAGAETDETVYDIYVNLLPEPDVLRLRQGIAVRDEQALQQLLEDLGG